PRQDIVEVVTVDFHELPIAHPRQWRFRLAGEIAKHADHEWQLFQLDGAANLDVVGDVDARRPHAIELMLQTLFLGHTHSLLVNTISGRGRGLSGSLSAPSSELKTLLRSVLVARQRTPGRWRNPACSQSSAA